MNDPDLSLPGAPQRRPVLALVCAAMETEVHPWFDLASGGGPVVRCAGGQLQVLQVGDAQVGLLQTGIGLVNASSALTAALGLVAPRYVFATGSAGGLAARCQVGDVVVSTRLRYSSADATGFGYELGQIPGMAPFYCGDEALLERALTGADLGGISEAVYGGEFLSADNFVMSDTVDQVRAKFPQGVAVDMESTALAQVASSFELPFLAVRGISDLCGPAANQENHRDAGLVAQAAAQVVLAALGLR